MGALLLKRLVRQGRTQTTLRVSSLPLVDALPLARFTIQASLVLLESVDTDQKSFADIVSAEIHSLAAAVSMP